MSLTRGVWDGSDIVEEHIEVLRHCHKFPSAELIATLILGWENSPGPREGEVVVFVEHFARGLGLPASHFFSGFLMHYSLHLHHLTPKAVLQLAPFFTLCKGFLGIKLCLDLWHQLFFFKKSLVKDPATGGMQMTSYGATLVHHRSGFPWLPM
ncbi:hypothetical protein D1007_51344 [Hordeum vulgare]|nr:hypothetical protein D1007_51344 [Hordeum vulgare]